VIAGMVIIFIEIEMGYKNVFCLAKIILYLVQFNKNAFAYKISSILMAIA
jgi:hypothetical protein